MNCAVNECKVMRLGRRSQGKLRPLEAVFRQDSDALEFFPLVNIHKKVTRISIFLCLETKHELKERSDKDEPNLTIKYIAGDPKITQKN
ncbi:hypothetical protein J437_LFUL003379 [Ladona fulva]|uniref:Uncharacterized protein n=1 Tax=Ladona fulva TaxID=123851 RepID=A0A8K0JTK1_LADFU|nr:hypothetical protein J437_LFUL003379 [Ladona fulva]